MKRTSFLLLLLLTSFTVFSQVNARLFRYPHISSTQITFVYGGDIWIVGKSGGTAIKLTSSPGEESYPRFSPDGKTIAYSATYNGNTDVFTMPASGGVPVRVTYQSVPDRVVDWHPDGNRILFASARSSGTQRYNQFYLVSKNGGLPDKLAIPYGELGSFSPSGDDLAYVTRITENYPFKRYRGGFASDIYVYNLKQNKVENITQNPATDGKPAWVKNKIFYVSDNDKHQRRNIWVYDVAKKTRQEITNFDKDDINYMSSGGGEVIFEAAGKLYVLNADTYKYEEVKISTTNDISTLMARTVNVANYVQNADISPDGKRAVIEARGELFNVPAEQGFVLNLTSSSGSFERNPSWSPDGKYIAYWSDASGENELYIRESTAGAAPKKLTSFGKGYGWNLYWSPDSKKIAFIDFEQAIRILTIATGASIVIDHTKNITFSGFSGFTLSWSSDNKWLAYSKSIANKNDAIFFYNTESNKVEQVTSGYYNDTRPVFDPGGKYLYFLTDRNFSPSYSSMDASWVYANSTQLAAAALHPSGKSLLVAKNDEVKVTVDTASAPKPAEKKEEPKAKADDKAAAKPPVVASKDIKVSVGDIETRVEVLPVAAGNFGELTAVEGKIIYRRFPNTGSGIRTSGIYFYDTDKREEKTIIGNASGFAVSKDGKSMLVADNAGLGVVKINPEQKIEKRLPTNEMEMILNPREEWTQIFNDTWRSYRDFFYDPNMHKVDWNEMKKQYGALINDAITRWDVSNIQIQLISELSAGHTYANGGDVERSGYREDGYLGIDWALDNNMYKIKRIVKPAKWDSEVRSPLEQAGVNIKEGDYIISVNGRALDPAIDPYASFEGLSGKTVSLRVNSKPSNEGTRDVIIKTISQQQEMRLRHLEWIESNRKKVETLSNGQLGYMYMPNTGAEGQTELLRQFYAQIDKKGFVIDERFNAGGQLADRFIEMLNRPVLYNLAWRDAEVTVWPVKGNDAPKVMLINGWAGSGGDAFPWAFQQLNLGPIVGERTLGILVGPATGHGLIDGGSITVPDARLYGNTGKWFAEGYGIKPDFEVWDDPAELVKGNDPQLIKGVEEAMKLIQAKPRKLYPRPAFENRTADGVK